MKLDVIVVGCFCDGQVEPDELSRTRHPVDELILQVQRSLHPCCGQERVSHGRSLPEGHGGSIAGSSRAVDWNTGSWQVSP